MKTKQVTYKDFMEWFNSCPVEILKYEDQVDHLMVTFDLPLCDDKPS